MNAKKMFLSIALVATSAMVTNVQASGLVKNLIGHESSESYSYEDKWCHDVEFILTNSLNAAYTSETFLEEAQILERAISRSLKIVNPKFSYFFESSLRLTQEISGKFSSDKDKVFFLRRNIQNALSDLRYLDGRSDDESQDYGDYAKIVLTRALEEGVRSKTDLIEMSVLNSSIRSAIQVLKESDFRRDPSYACSTRYLKEALTLENVSYKRDLVDSAISTLNGGCGF